MKKIIGEVQKFAKRVRGAQSLRGIQSTLMLTFTTLSLVIAIVLGVIFYNRFQNASTEYRTVTTRTVMEQTGENLENYLAGMCRISDTASYDVISENEIGDTELSKELYLLYEANTDSVRSIALYSDTGRLLAAAPVANEKTNAEVKRQPWFKAAIGEMENFHFSTPHIQNLFSDDSTRYNWVISLSRTVDTTDQGTPGQGVLLVDMNYTGIDRMMEQINDSTGPQYYYLAAPDGQIIYHPDSMQIYEGITSENSVKEASHADGIYHETYHGEKRTVFVRTISYTGWKLISVIPERAMILGTVSNTLFILLFILLTLMMVLIVNRFAARHISKPILALSDSVQNFEAGKGADIYIGGSPEIRHLGLSIQRSYDEIEHLMQQIVEEQNIRRKSEMDALQSQINPHFLYNTLDSITWMVEGGKNEEASYMISQLARLLRISLSKGRNIISIEDEIRHAKSYMNIQKVRYKDSFAVTFDVPEELMQYCTVKLVIQPLLENAIYYGVEGMDGEGEIRIFGEMKEQTIRIHVQDNGIGMPEDMVENLLTGDEKVHKRGSGVGLVNVNCRLQMAFGEEYGLKIISEPDEGTDVMILLPAIPYNEENRKLLEQGKFPPETTVGKELR